MGRICREQRDTQRRGAINIPNPRTPPLHDALPARVEWIHHDASPSPTLAEANDDRSFTAREKS